MLVKWILARLREPSTYGGLAALLLAVGVNIDETVLGSIGAAVAAVIAILVKEGQ